MKYIVNKVEISPYDPHWPNIFETEKTEIKKALGNIPSLWHEQGELFGCEVV